MHCSEAVMKKEIKGSITERGQVTVPAEVRRVLGIDKKGPVTFVIEDGVVTLRRPTLTWRDVGRSIQPVNTPEDWDARIREAKDDKADETVRRMSAR
jgi:bifunctional DNA-binding transcriptional regulator/antitoxin component of YhaV-PrlF toxin-antitoxin module